MPCRKPTTDYRIVGAHGDWFAFHRFGHLQARRPHVCQIKVREGKRLVGVTAVRGRTPFEALERLKRIEATAAAPKLKSSLWRL